MTDTPDQIVLRPSEIEVLVLLAEGLSVKQVTRRLHLGKTAVVMRMRRCRDRVGARSTAHLLAVCVREGLIDPPPLDAPTNPNPQHQEDIPCADSAPSTRTTPSAPGPVTAADASAAGADL